MTDETSPAHAGPPAQPQSLGDRLINRRALLLGGAAGIAAIGVGAAVALGGNGGGTTPVASGTPTDTGSASPSRTTTGRTTTTRSTSAPTTSATSSAATSSTTAATTTSTAPPTSTTRPPTSTTRPPTSTTRPPTSSSPPPTSTTTPPPAPTVLQGGVGGDDTLDIYLMKDGAPVSELPPGDYTIRVSDPAISHNFHLQGPGVDKATGVEEIVNVTWNVRLERGNYTYVCDPHAGFMKGDFKVR